MDQALDSVRPYMESHGGNVELLGIQDGIVHLRLQGSCTSCSASSSTLELAVRQALEQAAPDLDGMDVEGVVQGPGAAGIELPMAAPVTWIPVDGLAGLSPESARGRGRRGAVPGDRQRGGHAAGVRERVRRVRRTARRRGAGRRRADLPRLLADLLPAAGGALARRRRPAAGAGPAAARARRRSRWPSREPPGRRGDRRPAPGGDGVRAAGPQAARGLRDGARST